MSVIRSRLDALTNTSPVTDTHRQIAASQLLLRDEQRLRYGQKI